MLCFLVLQNKTCNQSLLVQQRRQLERIMTIVPEDSETSRLTTEMKLISHSVVFILFLNYRLIFWPHMHK